MSTNSFPAVEVHGHRGCRGLHPENTLQAFRHALALGVDVLEMDVVLSADGQVVVSHEPWFSPTICLAPDGKPLPSVAVATPPNLYTLPYSTIQTYDCGLTQHPGFPEQKSSPAYKPLLREVLQDAELRTQELGRPAVKFSIELKSTSDGDGVFHPAPEAFVLAVVQELERAQVLARTTLLCFDKRVLQAARIFYPALPLCLLVEDEMPFEEHLRELGFVPAVYGPSHHLVTPELVQQLLSFTIQLVPWTVNELPDMERVLASRPAGITTDYPDRLLALLGRHS